MTSFIKKFGIIALAAIAGALITLNITAFAQPDPSSKIPYKDLELLAQVFGKIKANYVDPVSDDKLIRGAIDGMVQNLDPHSDFLAGKELEDLKITTQGKFGGLGIEVTSSDGVIKVVSPIEDTPAFRAGIKAGDLIIKINDTLTRGLTLSKAVDMMRGKPGTSIKLTIARSGVVPFEVTITREFIKVKSVRYKMVEPGYGYVRISNFQENTGAELVKALDTLYKQQRLKGLVLDLRMDPGGLLEQAVAVSSAFLPQDSLVVYTKGRTPDSKMELKARRSDYQHNVFAKDLLASLPAAVKSVPMVVLIDAGTASASEIVSGALQDHQRAIIMGAPSFGKGSVQTIMPIDATHMLKLTTARYYTPSGRSIQGRGIEPDVIVDDGRDILRIREANLEHHIISKDDTKPADAKGHIVKPKEPPANLDDTPKPGAKPIPFKPFIFGDKNDFQLQQALNQLKGLPVLKSNRPKTAAAKPDVKKAETKNAEPAKAPEAKAPVAPDAKAAKPETKK
jgi:carboxyl-terminal processing protease